MSAQADKLQAFAARLEKAAGLPGKIVTAYVEARAGKREPLETLVRAWYGSLEVGPGAWDGARAWVRRLDAAVDSLRAPPSATADRPTSPARAWDAHAYQRDLDAWLIDGAAARDRQRWCADNPPPLPPLIVEAPA